VYLRISLSHRRLKEFLLHLRSRNLIESTNGVLHESINRSEFSARRIDKKILPFRYARRTIAVNRKRERERERERDTRTRLLAHV